MGKLETALLPCRFGDYVLLQMLGQGGMGAVWLAKQEGYAGIAKLCVVKTVRDNLTEDREYVARFVDEARTVVGLNHRNICHVFDIGKTDGQLYLAMEHIPGRDLRRVLERTGEMHKKLPEAVVLHIIGEVLDALDYAHRRTDEKTEEPLHLVHRDVSPQNIMVTFEGETKLIDFGLAVSRAKLQHTEPGVILGKLAYMSTEQSLGDDVDHRTDQFAAAVVCYELLAGERFYAGLSTNDIWERAGSGAFRPLRLGEIRPALRAVLDRALGSRDDRFASCADLRRALLTVQVASGTLASLADVRAVMEQLFPGEAVRDRQSASALSALPIDNDSPRTETMHIAAVADVVAQIARLETAPTVVLPATLQLPIQLPIATDFGRAAAGAPLIRAPRPHVPTVVAGVGAGLLVAVVAVAIALSPAPAISPAAQVDAGTISARPRVDAGVAVAQPARRPDGGVHAAPHGDPVIDDDAGAAHVDAGPRSVKKAAKRTPLSPLPVAEPTNFRDRLVFLRDQCVARVPCARRFAATLADFTDKVAAMSPDDLRQLNGDAVECIAKCRSAP